MSARRAFGLVLIACVLGIWFFIASLIVTDFKCKNRGIEGVVVTTDNPHFRCFSHNHSFGKLHRYYTTLDGVMIDE